MKLAGRASPASIPRD